MTSTNFLCPCHHDSLSEDSAKAMSFWGETVLMARRQIVDKQWHDVVNTYGNALETAGILLATDKHYQRAVMRYSRTAIEMAYVIRKVGAADDVDILIEMVSKRVLGMPVNDFGDRLFNVLFEVSALDSKHIDSWLDATLVQYTRPSSTSLH